MLKSLLSGLVFVCLLTGQSARFPSAIATDSDLKVSANFISTKLRYSISSTQTEIAVTETTGITAHMLLTVEREVVSVTSVSGSLLTVVRGFDGTTAAQHLAGRELRHEPTAWEINALRKEVQAMQAQLGVNLANLNTQNTTSTAIYKFSAQTPGGSLVVGNNSVELAPVPLGVNGTNSNHYLYVSGGTGTAEACLITGGTAVAGMPSGHVIIDCDYTHTGAWTIQSATAGIQEAINSQASTGSTLRVNDSQTGDDIYAPITVAKEGAKIMCASNAQPLRRASGVLFNVTAGSVEISNCWLEGGRTSLSNPAGNIALQVSGIRGSFHDLRIGQFAGGILHSGGFHNVFKDIWTRNLGTYVLKATDGVSPYIINLTHAADPGYDVASDAGIWIATEGSYIEDCDILHTAWGLRIQPETRYVSWTFVYDSRFDQNFYGGILVQNASSYDLQGVFLDNVWSASAGMAGTHEGDSPTMGMGLYVTRSGSGALDTVVVTGGQILNNRDQNVKVIGTATNIAFNGVEILGANAGQGANIDNVYLETTGPVNLTGGRIVAPAAPQAHRSAIATGANSGRVNVRDVAFDTSAGSWSAGTAIYNVASTAGNVRNFGYSNGIDDTPIALASAATVNLPVVSYVHIEGTTTIDNFLPVWQGRKLMLYKSGAGSVTISAAGNVLTGFTFASGTRAICEYNYDKWMCRQ